MSVTDELVCALREDHQARCWQLPSGDLIGPPPGQYSRVAAGHRHGCAIRTDGTVGCWGSNADEVTHISVCVTTMEAASTGSSSPVSGGCAWT